MKGSQRATVSRIEGRDAQLRRRFDIVARRAAKRILAEYSRVVGVVVNGSVGRGEPMPYSDVDVLAVMKGGRTPGWFSYFDDGIHVAVGFETLKEFGNSMTTHRRFFWKRGSVHSARVLHDPTGITLKTLRRMRTAKATPRAVETIAWREYCDILEYVGKLRNGWLLNDECLTRYAARVIAEKVQEVVIALNDIFPVSENVVWHQVMKARKKPRHLSTDYPMALGIKGKAGTQLVFTSTLRLARETIELIRTEFCASARNARFKALMKQPVDHYMLD